MRHDAARIPLIAMAARAHTLAPGVHRIALTPFDFINAFAIEQDDGQVTLVDTGVASSGSRVVDALASLGIAPERVTSIVLTHAHPDHLGGLETVRRHALRATVSIHEADAEFARAGVSPPRDTSTFLGRVLSRGAPKQEWAPAAIDGQVVDGEVIPGTGLQAHHTPGHSPGHIALLHQPTGVLITGDSIFNMPWGIRWSFSAFCTDVALTKRTAHVLAELDYDIAAFTHGPHISVNARETVRSFLRRRNAGADE